MPAPQHGQIKVGVGTCAFASSDNALSNGIIGTLTFNNCRPPSQATKITTGYHRSDIVKSEAERLNIELIYLPPYSPNLSPIKRLWKVINKHARNGEYFAFTKEFRWRISDLFTP
jgi:hypothetical protein